MKLLPCLLASTQASIRGLDPQQAIQHAHVRVRNGFIIPKMAEIIEEQQLIIEAAMDPLVTFKGIDINELAFRALNLTHSFRTQGSCDSSFPTLDGSCQNENDDGRSMSIYKRLVPADYCNEQDLPRCDSEGDELPHERQLSLEMKKQAPVKTSDDVNYAFTAWGQFITHDTIQTPDSASGKIPCDCSEHPLCHNMELVRDPVLRFRCLFIIRSASQLGMQFGNPVREQINQLSSFIDATTIYGFTKKHLNFLIASNKMHLKMQDNKFGDFLPTVDQIPSREIKLKFRTAQVFNEMGHEEFVSGDTRVLENPVLSSFHTVFARLHNFAVDEILKVNPHWITDTSRVFHEARLFVIAMIQHITYEEHLPALLGPIGHDMVINAPEEEPEVLQMPGFSPPKQNDPSIRNEFNVAGYRWGHAQVPDVTETVDGHLQKTDSIKVQENYFDPNIVWKAGPGECLRGAVMGQTNSISGQFGESVHNNLFKPNNFHHGVDLLSINIGRGREHGVGAYEKVRNFCMNHPQYSKLYQGLPSMQNGFDNIVAKYKSSADVDLYVGLLFEKPSNGAQVGPTTQCLNVDQFIALKKGDRFFYSNPNVYNADQLAEIKRSGLSKVMCTQLEGSMNTPKNPFIKARHTLNGFTNHVVSCESIGSFDFSSWKEGHVVAPTSEPEEEEEEVTIKPDATIPTTKATTTTTTKATTTTAPPAKVPNVTPKPMPIFPFNARCDIDTSSTFQAIKGKWTCKDTPNGANKLCNLACDAKHKPDGARTRLICNKRKNQWQLRGNTAKPAFKCVPFGSSSTGSSNGGSSNSGSNPINGGKLCQIADFETQFMRVVTKNFPNSIYRFSLGDFLIKPALEGEFLKIKMFFGSSHGTHSGVMTKCRVIGKREKWVTFLKIDPQEVKTAKTRGISKKPKNLGFPF